MVMGNEIFSLHPQMIGTEKIKVFWGDVELQGVTRIDFMPAMNMNAYERYKRKQEAKNVKT